jgi:phosphoribosylglycinamide formyltransferase-1
MAAGAQLRAPVVKEPRITVLISGRGSNLAALLEAEREHRLGGAVATVVSNRADAAGLALALAHGTRINVVDHRAHASRDAFDAALAEAVDHSQPDLVVLAGFMRILGPAFVSRYAGRMLNIHPSLLPAYPGLDTHRRALADGVRIHGCTVHFVTPELDHGPVVAQAAVAVLPGDDEAALAARVLAAEHELLPAAVRAFCTGRLAIDGRRVVVRGERTSATNPLFVPVP